MNCGIEKNVKNQNYTRKKTVKKRNLEFISESQKIITAIINNCVSHRTFLAETNRC